MSQCSWYRWTQPHMAFGGMMERPTQVLILPWWSHFPSPGDILVSVQMPDFHLRPSESESLKMGSRWVCCKWLCFCLHIYTGTVSLMSALIESGCKSGYKFLTPFSPCKITAGLSMARSSWMKKMLSLSSGNIQLLKSRSLLCGWGGSKATLCVLEQCRSSQEVFQVCSCCSTMAGAQISLVAVPFPVIQRLLSRWTPVLSISALCLQAQHPCFWKKEKAKKQKVINWHFFFLVWSYKSGKTTASQEGFLISQNCAHSPGQKGIHEDGHFAPGYKIRVISKGGKENEK